MSFARSLMDLDCSPIGTNGDEESSAADDNNDGDDDDVLDWYFWIAQNM